MHKSILNILFIAIGPISFFFATSAAAQTLNFNPTITEQTNSSATAGKQVMSPQEFGNTVSKMGQQTKNNLNQQATKEFVKQPPVGTPKVTPPSPNEEFTPDDKNKNPVPPAPTTAAPAPQQAAPTTLSPPPLAAPQPPPSSYSIQPSSPQPSQNQPYSGFGTGNPNNNPNNSTAPSSGASGSGWGIKY